MMGIISPPTDLLAWREVISPFSINSYGAGAILGAPASAAWPQVHRVIYWPFRVTTPFPVNTLFLINGAVANGNFDLAVFHFQGRRLVATGTTAQAGINQAQAINVAAANVILSPGDYYGACVLDNVAGTIFRYAFGLRIAGNMQEVLGVMPLPAQAAFAADATGWAIAMGISSRSFA